MKKLINDIESLLEDSLKGFASVHRDIITFNQQPYFVSRKVQAEKGKVALISGGGSGHEPLHTGLVGVGMLDAACPGQVFTSPTPDQMIAAATAVANEAGVLFIVKNYLQTPSMIILINYRILEYILMYLRIKYLSSLVCYQPNNREQL